MARRGRPRRAALVKYRCRHCGKPYQLPKWRQDGTAFCSQSCYWEWRRGRPQPWLRKPPDIRRCPQCGKEFEVAGYGAANRNRRRTYCSKECAGTRVHSEPRQLSGTEAAYLAGFFDGEGSLIQVKQRYWRIVIYQSDEAVIRWIADVTGTGFIGSRVGVSSNLIQQPVHPRQQWFWQLYGRNAALFLAQLLPYLRVKRERAQMAVDAFTITIDPA